MELIYTGSDGIDIGVVDCADLDYDTAGEMDFELKVKAGGLGLERGSLWYVYDEEYMGIVEDIKVDSEENTITYAGTNTRGLLSKKVFEADRSVVQFTGNAGEIIDEIIADSDCSDMFVVDETEIEIVGCNVLAYSSVYDVMMTLLRSVNAVPIFKMKSDRKMHIEIDLRDDLSDEIQYLGHNTFSFAVSDIGNAYNHMVLRAVSESENYTIHLFTNELGGIQEYALTDNPLKDADYILDKRNQLLFGRDERAVVETYEIDVTENYIRLTSRPPDWSNNFSKYYTGEDGNYSPVEPVVTEVYTPLTKKPSDWNMSYANYYERTSSESGGSSFGDGDGSSEGEFSPVRAITTQRFKRLTKKPFDWSTNWGIYYQHQLNSGGTEYEYVPAAGVEKNKFEKQIAKPSDWSTGFRNYYRIKKKKYVKVEGTGKNKSKAPKWVKNKYYTNVKKTVAPKFSSRNYYYVYDENTSYPPFVKNRYFSKFNLESAPAFRSGFFYKQVLDHYASMVADGLEKLMETSPTMTAEMKIEDYECRIGDVVGCVDEKAGISITEEITNIIFKITDGIEEYEYKIGGN